MADLFTSADQARRLRDIGLDRVESSNYSWVKLARMFAERIAAKNGEVVADDIRKLVEDKILEEPKSDKAWGAVFRSKRLKWCGRMRPSAVTSRHAGLQRVWEYVETTA